MTSLFFGIIVGAAFASLSLQAPAPDNINAILGIVGIFLGQYIINLIW